MNIRFVTNPTPYVLEEIIKAEIESLKRDEMWAKYQLVKGNPEEAVQWLKAVAVLNPRAKGIWVNGEEKPIQYSNGLFIESSHVCSDDCIKFDDRGCCRWTESEFLDEFSHDVFQFTPEQAADYLKSA